MPVYIVSNVVIVFQNLASRTSLETDRSLPPRVFEEPRQFSTRMQLSQQTQQSRPKLVEFSILDVGVGDSHDVLVLVHNLVLECALLVQ